MATYEIVYWRSIPTQVKAKAGRARASRQLAERFMLAVDQAAMRAGLSNTDDYLEEWRTSASAEREGEPDAVAEAVASELEAAYPAERLEALAQNGGLDPAPPSAS